MEGAGRNGTRQRTGPELGESGVGAEEGAGRKRELKRERRKNHNSRSPSQELENEDVALGHGVREEIGMGKKTTRFGVESRWTPFCSGQFQSVAI